MKKDITQIKQNNSVTLGEYIRNNRVDQGKSSKVIASIVGIKPSTYCDIERNRANPSVNVLFKIAAELDLSVDFLIKNYVNNEVSEISGSGGGANG